MSVRKPRLRQQSQPFIQFNTSFFIHQRRAVPFVPTPVTRLSRRNQDGVSFLKVKDPIQQQELLESAITHNLSIDQIQEKVKSLRLDKSEKPMALPQRLAIPKQLQQAKVWEDPQKKKKLEKLLNELERLLEQS